MAGKATRRALLGLATALATGGVTAAAAQDARTGPRPDGKAKGERSKTRTLERGVRALVPFNTAPFPYDGIVPATGLPFLDVTVEERAGRQSPRTGGIYFADETYSDRRVLLDVPAGFTVSRAGVMVIFFHGNGATLERDVIGRQRVPEQVALAGLNSVLVAPQLAFDALDSSAGQFWLQGAFSAFLDETAKELARLTGARGAARYFRQLPMVLIGYSGGYHPIAFILHHAAHERIAGVVLLDALYGDLEKFETWITSRDAGFFVSSFTKSSADRNLELQRLLAARQVSMLDALPGILKPGTVVFPPSLPNVLHAEFVARAWGERPVTDVLMRSGASRR